MNEKGIHLLMPYPRYFVFVFYGDLPADLRDACVTVRFSLDEEIARDYFDLLRRTESSQVVLAVVVATSSYRIEIKSIFPEEHWWGLERGGNKSQLLWKLFSDHAMRHNWKLNKDPRHREGIYSLKTLPVVSSV